MHIVLRFTVCYTRVGAGQLALAHKFNKRKGINNGIRYISD